MGERAKAFGGLALVPPAVSPAFCCG